MAKKKSEEVADAVNEPVDAIKLLGGSKKLTSVSDVVSTGSTLLDLAISGGRRRGGGIPPGILVEFYGPSSSGKSALLSEICASAQKKGGECRFCDPEGRLDSEYTEIYGVSISEQFEYYRPDTVKEMFNEYLWKWQPKDTSKINVFAGDSIAALSSDMEMEDEDKMGGRRAKELSAGLRKSARLIASPDKLIVFSNQIRIDMKTGREKATGGEGLPFYASLRIRVGPAKDANKIVKTKTVNGKAFEKILGIKSECIVKKSSVDSPYRSANIYIVFNYGIDDVRGNLQYIKDCTKATSYDCIDKTYVSMDDAIAYIEENNYENVIRENTIDIWEGIEKAFKIERKLKDR